MAFISLSNSEVTRVNRSGNGVQVTEKWSSRGGEFKQNYTVWFENPHTLVVGDLVSVSGLLSAKLGAPWEDREGKMRQSIELSINSPKRTDSTPATPAAAPADEPWAAAASYESEAPF